MGENIISNVQLKKKYFQLYYLRLFKWDILNYVLALCNTPDVGKVLSSLLRVHRFCSGLIQSGAVGLAPFADSRAFGIELLFEDLGCLCCVFVLFVTDLKWCYIKYCIFKHQTDWIVLWRQTGLCCRCDATFFLPFRWKRLSSN